MSKPEWGVKRTCQSCAAKFYDLNRAPIVCPKCGAPFDPETVLRSRRGRANAVARPDKPGKPAKPAQAPAGAEDSEAQEGKIEADLELEIDEGDEDLADLGDDEPDDDIIEDTSDLGEDDDMSEVLVTEDEEET